MNDLKDTINQLLEESEKYSDNAAAGYEGWYNGEMNAYSNILAIIEKTKAKKNNISKKDKVYMNILNNHELKEKYDTGEIKIPDNIISSFIKEKYVFKIDNKEEKNILAYNLARNPLINYTGIIPEYNKDMPYVYMDKEEIIYSDFVDAIRQRGSFLFTDFSKILIECKKMLIQNQYESLCFEDKKIAEYGYEFNDGDQIWNDTTEIYKIDNDNLFIKKYEAGYTSEVKYSTISLNNLIEEIQQFKKDKGKNRKGGCFIIKDLPNEYYKVTEKLNTNIKNFCDGTIAIKVNSQKELDELIKTIQDKVDCHFWDDNKYYSDYPYYFVNGNNFLDSVKDMKYISYEYRCLKDNRRFITDYMDFKDIKTMDLNNNEEVDNDIELD